MNNRPLDLREFFRLLQRRTRRTAKRIDRMLRERVEGEVTILVSDSSGFTRRTHQYGIAQFLAVMTQNDRRLAPIFRRHRGSLLAQTEDKMPAVFPDPTCALRTSVEIQQRLRRSNAGRKDADQFHLSIGIESGPAPVLTDNVQGARVNVASKLGEGLAAKGEILVTGGVARRGKPRFRCAYPRSEESGGRPFELCRVSY
jgi:class 3 adenylate cyclase